MASKKKKKKFVFNQLIFFFHFSIFYIFFFILQTTSVGMSWMLYMLATNPDIQIRLRREICEFDFSNIVLEKLDRLPYLNAFIQETLRLYPPVPLTNRVSVEEDEFNGVRIPKGTVIMLCRGVTQRSDSIWQDPMEFKPERFLPVADGGTGEFAKIHRMNYSPFSHGPRMCIGHRFATVEMKAVVAVLVSKFEFFIPENSPTFIKKLTITMRPYPDLRLGVRPVTEASI